MSIRFFSGGHSTNRTEPDPARRDEQLRQVAVADRRVAADVEHPAVADVAGAGAQERVGGVVDIDEVAQLRSVAEDLDLAALDAPAG